MTPTELLTEEHRRINETLDRLEQLVDQSGTMGMLDRTEACAIVAFLQDFADQRHHGKEEGILFPLLARRGLERQYGRTGVMVYEHNQGRRHIRLMSRVLRNDWSGAPDEVKRFCEHALAYINLMRRHIDKEDHCLFPWVERNLTDGERRWVQDAFSAVERNATKECHLEQ